MHQLKLLECLIYLSIDFANKLFLINSFKVIIINLLKKKI